MMNFIVLLLVWTTLVPINECVRLRDWIYRSLVDVLSDLQILAAAPTTVADWRQYEALNLTTPPECPMTTQYYSCDKNGFVDTFKVSLPPNTSKVLPLSWSPAAPLEHIVIENFVGDFGGFKVINSRESVTVRNSILYVETNGSHPFIFPSQRLFFTNVSLPFYRYNASLNNVPISFTECLFVNVTLRCPVPPWLVACFANSTVQPPCQTVEPPLVYSEPPRCRSGTVYWCDFECPPPAVGFNCTMSSAFDAFFPAQLGNGVFEIMYVFFGEAEDLLVTTRGSIGIVTRVELWDWRTLNWTLALDRPMPTRRLGHASNNEERLPMPHVLTNRVRVTVEQWVAPRDVILNIELVRSLWPMEARTYTRLPENCGSVQIFGSRSILDETVADSLCIGRVCQFACTANAANFTFDRVVNASYLVLQGGDVWSGGTLVAAVSQASDGTRIYALPREPTKFVNVTGTGNVVRARLIGNPLDNETLPAVSVPPQRRHLAL